ncbi:hypothetical protein F116p55 [Pseudomonas phage F116]|uniref:Uncharacterized protein n=1 Tax=Pseudomonas phage F116 TaxID=2679904 RepID=Q5QF57_9CAUD|nr:hypothetical protein F116p55 [Pseudomonas phage F116]AAT47246.1 unknown [Pseudomonas phage F116]
MSDYRDDSNDTAVISDTTWLGLSAVSEAPRASARRCCTGCWCCTPIRRRCRMRLSTDRRTCWWIRQPSAMRRATGSAPGCWWSIRPRQRIASPAPFVSCTSMTPWCRMGCWIACAA